MARESAFPRAKFSPLLSARRGRWLSAGAGSPRPCTDHVHLPQDWGRSRGIERVGALAGTPPPYRQTAITDSHPPSRRESAMRMTAESPTQAAGPVPALSVDASTANNAERHDLQFTRAFYASPPQELRRRFACRVVGRAGAHPPGTPHRGADDGGGVRHEPRCAVTIGAAAAFGARNRTRFPDARENRCVCSSPPSCCRCSPPAPTRP